MNDNVFVDTNILLYSRDASEPAKQAIAVARLDELWRKRTGRLSVQVLNEYFVEAPRPLTGSRATNRQGSGRPRV